MIELYDLSKKSYTDLRKSMTEAIPHYTRRWNDFNYSDPGITIIELLSFVADTLLYRTNRIPDESYLNFLRLVAGATRDEIGKRLDDLLDKENQIIYKVYNTDNGTGSDTSTDYVLYIDQAFIEFLNYLKKIEEGNKKTVLEMQRILISFWEQPFRAFTEKDFNTIAIGMTSGIKEIKSTTDPEYATLPLDAQIVRTWMDCIEDQIDLVIILGQQFIFTINEDNVLTTETVYVRDTTNDERFTDQYSEVIKAFNTYIAPRLIIGTILSVVPPTFTSVYMEVAVKNSPFAIVSELTPEIKQSIVDFLDPITGGADHTGWPYNQPLVPQDIKNLLRQINGVESVTDVFINETMKLNQRSTVGLNTYLGVLPIMENSGAYFVGLPKLEQLIITIES